MSYYVLKSNYKSKYILYRFVPMYYNPCTIQTSLKPAIRDLLAVDLFSQAMNRFVIHLEHSWTVSWKLNLLCISPCCCSSQPPWVLLLLLLLALLILLLLSCQCDVCMLLLCIGTCSILKLVFLYCIKNYIKKKELQAFFVQQPWT